jgi:hypothetical protein
VPAVPAVPAADLFEVASTTVTRPDRIARGQVPIEALLRRALVDDWYVRLAYTNRAGRSTQLTGAVLDIDDEDLVLELVSGWDSRVLSLSRIEWARVLTEAEEDAI